MMRRLLILFGLLFNCGFAQQVAANPETEVVYHHLTVIADIHFNPFADCPAKNGKCPEAIELNKAKVSEWPAILAKYNSQKFPSYGQETNYKLFSSLLSQIGQQKPENVLILGDFLAHNFYLKYLSFVNDNNKKDYQKFVLNTLAYLTNSMQQILPENSSIFPVIGNNDSYGGIGCMSPDYCSETNGDFFKNTAKIWAPLFKNKLNQKEFSATYSKAGYYEITLPDSNHLLILNTVLFSHQAQGYKVDQAANAQIAWLKSRLKIYKRANQKAWIAWHIPPGVDAYSTASSFFQRITPFWKETYNTQVLNLIHQYTDTVTGVFSGHLHMDGFLWLDSNEKSGALVDSFVPAISPIFGNNAAYKIYDYDSKNLQWCNFTTYYLSLINTSVGQDLWNREYTFNAAFQTNSQNCTLIPGFAKIALNKDDPFTTNYLTFYNVSSNFKSIPQQAWKTFWCAIRNLDIADYENCLMN